MKKIVSLIFAFLLFFNSVDILSISKVFASELNVIVSNGDYTKILTVDSENSLFVNGNKVESKWEREFYFSDSGAYTNRVQELKFNSTNLDLNDITFGTYKSDYTGEIKAFKVKIIDPLYLYHYSTYQSGSGLEDTFIDCRGKRTPRYLDGLNPNDSGYLIINAGSGKVEDFYSNLNFYYCNHIEESDFDDEETMENPILPVIEEKPVIQNIIATNNSLEVMWSAVPFATSYEIEVDGQRLDKSQSNKILDGNLSPVSEHTYRVRAINSTSVGEWSDSVTENTLLNTPTNTSATSTPSTIQLNWDKVDLATKYEIKINNTVINDTLETNYEVTGLNSGTKYTYQIRAKNNTTQSNWSDSKEIYTRTNSPSNANAIESNDRVQFTWTSSTGSTGYDIMIDNDIINTTRLTYTHILSSKGPHIYKIRSKDSSSVGEWTSFNVVSAPPSASNISVVNNKFGVDDLVNINGLVEDDLVKVYSSQTGGLLLGESYVSAGTTSAKIQISQLGSASGNIYVAVKKPGTNESLRTSQTFLSEASPALSPSYITVVNNYIDTADTVTVSALSEGDIINVYNTGGNQIGTGKVDTGETTVVVTVPQLGSTSGTVYVSVIKVNKLESTKVGKGYSSEPTSTEPLSTTIAITNNKFGINDTVLVTGLVEKDIINVYNSLTGGTLIGSGTVGTGNTSLTISIPQLGSSGGTLYFSKKSEGKLESSRVAKGFE